jgi:hypothetical protein
MDTELYRLWSLRLLTMDPAPKSYGGREVYSTENLEKSARWWAQKDLGDSGRPPSTWRIIEVLRGPNLWGKGSNCNGLSWRAQTTEPKPGVFQTHLDRLPKPVTISRRFTNRSRNRTPNHFRSKPVLPTGCRVCRVFIAE